MWVGLGLAHTSALELNQKTYHTHQLSVTSRDNRTTHKVLRVVQLVKIAAFFCYEKILFVTNVKDSESLTFGNDLVLNLPSPLSLYCCNRRGVGGLGTRLQLNTNLSSSIPNCFSHVYLLHIHRYIRHYLSCSQGGAWEQGCYTLIPTCMDMSFVSGSTVNEKNSTYN